MSYVQHIDQNLATPYTFGKDALAAGTKTVDNIPGHTAAAAVVFSRTVHGGGIGTIAGVVSAGTVSGAKVVFTSTDNTETSQIFWHLKG